MAQIVLYAASASQENKTNTFLRSICKNTKNLIVHQKEHKKKKANMKEQDYIDNIEDTEFIIDINDDTLATLALL